jgi:DNA-binding IclR family transcriptional regulator
VPERSSPPTARVILVLEHLARRPAEARTVTQLARELRMPRATCALIVEELVGLGWLARHADGVVLGTGAVPVGRAALAGPGGAAVARDALAALAAELDVVCTVSGLVGGDIVVLDRAGPDRPAEFDVRVGSRYPFAPPLGIMNIAWEPDRTIEEWMGRSAWPLPEGDVVRLWEAVHDVRRHGVLIERLTDHLFHVHAVLAGMASEDLPDALRRAVGDVLYPLAGRDYLRRELRAGRRYPVSIIAAPAFDDGGRQRFLIGAFVADRNVPYARIVAIADRVIAAGAAVTAAIGGTDPWRTPHR